MISFGLFKHSHTIDDSDIFRTITLGANESLLTHSGNTNSSNIDIRQLIARVDYYRYKKHKLYCKRQFLVL